VEELSRPILEEFALSLGTLTCDENTVAILQGNRSRLPVLFISSDAKAERKVMLRCQDSCRAMDTSPQHCAYS